MLRTLFDKYPLGSFYTLSVLIVILVMAIGVPLMLSNPAVAGMMPALFGFIEERGSYANLVEIVAFTFQVQPAATLILLFAAAPALAAIVASVLRSDSGGLRSLLSRFRPWRNGVSWQQGVRVWVSFFVVYLAIAGAFIWLTNSLAGPYALDKTAAIIGTAPLAVVLTLVLGAFIDEGGTLEELGWRGYALPLLLDKMRSPLRATIILAILWWAWHLPREITSILSGIDASAFLIGQSIFLLLCIGLSIVITYVFNLTGGSVWAGILIHGGTNVWSKALQGPLYGALGFDLRTAIVLVIAVAILLLTRGRLGAPDPQQHRPENAT